MRLRHFAIAAAVACVSATALPAQTVVLVVRHAERAPGSGDVPISDLGRARAVALAEVARASGVSVIVTTQLQRTRQTAEPLAMAMGIAPVVITTQSDIARHAAEVAAAVRQHAGKTLLVVGHSNTVPAIVAALGGPKFPDLCESEYDALFTVIIDANGTARTIKSRFGAPTPVDAACASMR